MGVFISVIVVLNPLYNTSIRFPNIIFMTSVTWAFAMINYVILMLKISFVFKWKFGWEFWKIWYSCNLSLYLHHLIVFSLTVFFILDSNLWPWFPEYGAINCNVCWVSLLWGFVVSCWADCESSWSIILLATLSGKSLYSVKICRR